jgi:hypothetical protein
MVRADPLTLSCYAGGDVRRTAMIITATSTADGKLFLEIPAPLPAAQFEVHLTLTHLPRKILPHDYFDLIGSIKDPTFVRPPQGEYPKPVDLE